MIQDQDLLKRIMGMPDSVTGKLVALRKNPGEGQLETGVWYSNFTRVREEAAYRGIPFFGMWTNGDLCGFCRRFTANLLDPSFMSWMKSSGGLWWFGGSMDDSEQDKRGGIGFKWCIGPSNDVNYFPFFTVFHVENAQLRHAFFGSGHDYDKKSNAPEGARNIIDKINDVLSSPYVARPVKAYNTAATPFAINPVYHIRLNPDWDANHIARFQSALKDNGGHCVCKKDKTPDTMCMCKEFLSGDRPGLCPCGAFERYRV